MPSPEITPYNASLEELLADPKVVTTFLSSSELSHELEGVLNLRLERKWLSDECTIGELFIDGEFFCFTLEDKVRPYPEKIPGKTAIWEGGYRVTIDYSPKFKKDMPHVLDVPLFEGIRIHPGNTDEDTEGCILLGTMHTDREVLNSRVAFGQFFPRLENALSAGDGCWLTVVNPIEQLQPAGVA